LVAILLKLLRLVSKMSKYNIYKLKHNSLSDLVEKLTSVRYKELDLVQMGDYELTILFTPNPIPTPIWWLDQYSVLFGDYSANENTIYSGAIIARNIKDDSVYIVALGKTHFYIQEFIDYKFGLECAERIGSQSETKSKSSKLFGGQTSKTITSYTGSSVLNFSPGEATDYIKLKPVDKELWGKSYIHFGTSVQLGSINKDLSTILDDIKQAEGSNPRFNLPRMIPVTDKALISQLDNELAEAINKDNCNIGIVDFELYGVDFVFAQETGIRLYYEDTESKSYETLDISDIKDFALTNNINLGNCIRDIKAKLFVNDRGKHSTYLLKMIDFVGENNAFLHQGKWYIFSKSFMEALEQLVSNVNVSRSEFEFSKSEHEQWKIEQPEEEKVNYRERYVIDKIVKSDTRYVENDRNFDYKPSSGKTYAIEVSDIYDTETDEVIVVKIGGAKDFGYAFDQAIRTLSMVLNNKYTYENKTTIQVNNIKLMLVSDQSVIPSSASEINSLSFKIKLGELMRVASEKNVKLNLVFAKYVKGDKNGTK